MTTQLTIPWDLKYKFAMGGWTSNLKGFMYAIREKYGATAALEIHEKLCKRADRVKNMTNAILNVFQLEGNDAETMGKWWDLYFEICGIEGTILERSKTIARTKITKCPFKTDPKDLSEWVLIWFNLVVKTINPKATVERPIGMCAGDPHCEYIFKLEE